MTSSTEPDAGFHDRMRHLDDLLRDVDAIPDPTERTRTAQIIQSLMDFHGAGLRAIVARLAAAGETGRAILEDLARNDLVGNLLLLYDLHPLDLESRARLALDKVRPYVASRGASLTLVGVTPDGAVRVRLDRSGHSCPSSAAALKTTIEQAIMEKASDATSIEVEGDPTTAQPNGFVPVEHLTLASSKRHSAEGVLNHAQ